MTNWRSIATAPKDGTPILIETDDEDWPVAVVKFDSSPYFNGVYGWKDNDEARYDPERWLPLPAGSGY